MQYAKRYRALIKIIIFSAIYNKKLNVDMYGVCFLLNYTLYLKQYSKNE